MSQPDLDTVLRYLDGAEGWASCFSQAGVDWLSNVRRRYRTRPGVVAHDLTIQAVLSALPSHVSYAQGVRRLRRLCRETGRVPTCCKVPLAVFAESATPFSQTAFSDVWSAILEGRRVAVKALRLHGDQINYVRRVSVRDLFLRRGTECRGVTGISARAHHVAMPAPSKHCTLHWHLRALSRLARERVDVGRNGHCVPAGVSELGTIVFGKLLCPRMEPF
jgi:hypothetical protein